jgi:hypothetical protein
MKASALSLMALAQLLVGPASAKTPFDGTWDVAIVSKAGSCESSVHYRVTVEDGRVLDPAMSRGTSPAMVTSGCRSADPMPTASSTAERDPADGVRRPAAADGKPPANRNPAGRRSGRGTGFRRSLSGATSAGEFPKTSSVSAKPFALQPGAHQQQVRRACRQQRHRQRDMHSLAG